MEKDVTVTKSFFKKLTALLMAVLMLVSACPVSAFAVDASTPVSLNGSTFMQGDAVKAEFYSSGNGSEWYGLYYADATPASGNSIAWAYPSKLKSGSDIASYEMWKALDNDADADINNGDAFYYQSSDGKWHLSPGKYKFVYFSNGSYTSFTESKVAYFDVTDGSGSTPDVDYTPSLSVNKTTFCIGEDILVTASGSGEAWIGIHLKGDTPGDGNSYYWYNVSGSSGNGVSSTSGTEYAIQDKVAGGGSDGNFDAGAGLPVGEYVIRYFADGGYSSISFTKEIKVVSHSNISETSVTKASFKNEGAVNGSCGVCGAATVKEIIGKATMELASDNFEYTGSPVEAPVIVRDAKGNVISSDNYTVQYKQNTEISTDTVYAVATVTFKSTCERYQGSYSLKYYIVEPHTHNFTKDIVTKATFDKDGKIEKGCTECAAVNSASAVVIPKVSYAVVEKTGYHYTGSAITPAVTVKDSSGKTFQKGTDYTVTYSDNINKGTATAAVTLLGAYYEGTKAISFSIGSMELEKSVYEEGDKIKLTLTASGSADEWIGIYNKSVTPSASAPSIVWGNTSAMTSGMDIADYDSWSNLSSGGVNNADLFGFKTDDGVWHLSKGEYKVVVFADSGYTVSQSIDFTVKEKELRKDVTVKTDKSAYSEYDTIKVTVVNGKVTDAVAIYKSGSDVPVKKVTLTSGSTVSISPKLFSSGTYKAVVLQDSMEAYKIAESAEFTVTRTSVHGKYIVLNKSAYCTGEDIVVTAEGKNKDWLGIYGTADVIGDPNITAPASYYWYYVDGKRDDSSTTYKSGDTVVLNSYTNLGERSFFTHGDLPVGLYKVVLFENDTFTELDKIEISVKEHKYTLAETKAATCTANGYEKYVCTGCGKSKQNVLYASHKDDNSNQVCDICSAAIKAVLSGECGANGNNVTYTLYDDGTLMIKGSGEMKEYWYASPFSSENKVKKVVISSGVTSVGSWAFANCTAIESVTIPSSVKKIGNWAFSGCSGLKKVNISSGLTYIGMRAFNNCTALEAISLPSSLTTIDDNAFYSCLSLKSIVIPDNTTYIGAYAFYDCSSLESVTIGKKVSEIGIYAFLRCSALSDITVKDGNTSFVSEDGVLFNNAKTTLIQYPAGSSKTTYTVPSTVTTISWSAFYGSSALVRVTIGSGVKTIETEAFSACTGIESITIPANVTSVGYRAFYGCSALMSISFLNTQCTVSDGADTIYSGATIYGKSGSTAEAYANKYERTFKTTCSHSNTTAHGKVTATCSAPGYTAGTYCNDCKTWISGRTEIPATSHTEATVKGYAATCTTAGLTDGKKCSVCQTVLSAQSIIPATGHKEETIKGYAATCTVPGLTDGKKCSVCQTLRVPQKIIEAKGHSYVKTVTAPTCIAQGYTVYNCACGSSYVSDYVPENGHTVTAYSAKDPTCKAIGWYAYEECSVCDYSTYTERPVVDHKDENGDFKCDYDCGYEFTKPSEETTTEPSEETTTKPSEETTTEPSEETTTEPSDETTTEPSEEPTTEPSTGDTHTHEIVVIPAISPTCTASGYTEGKKCSVCQTVIVPQKVIEAKGHSYTATVTAATCITQGYTIYTCVCSDSYISDIVPANGHSKILYAEKNPTCREKGWFAYEECSVCDYSTYTERPVTSHADTDGDYKCDFGCGFEFEKPVTPEEPTTVKPSEEPTTKPSTPQTHTHTVVIIPAVSATYTKTGLTEGKKCSVCGKTLVSQKKVARKKLSKVSSLSKKAVTLAKGSKSTLTLSWKKVTGAEKYEIYRYVNKKWKKIKTTSKTSYKVTKLTANKTYKFKVRAVAGTNIGSFSKVLTAKTVPLKPTLTVKAGKKQLTASWKTVASITGYEVQYSTSKKFTKKTTKTSKITKAKTTKKTIKSLKKGKKYYVRVRAYKTVNGKKVYSSWSSVKSVKVK